MTKCSSNTNLHLQNEGGSVGIRKRVPQYILDQVELLGGQQRQFKTIYKYRASKKWVFVTEDQLRSRRDHSIPVC